VLDAEFNSASNDDGFKAEVIEQKRWFEPKYWVFDLILLVYPADIHLRTRVGFLIGCIVCRISFYVERREFQW
jgi:hypothetical protein